MDKRMTNCEEESGKGSEPSVDLGVGLSFLPHNVHTYTLTVHNHNLNLHKVQSNG